MTTVAEARALIEEALPAPRRERVALREAAGRALAEALLAPFDQPRFDSSAVDGFAVRAADLAQARPDRPVRLRLAGAVAAGESPAFTLSPGECAQVMTGARPPAGADAMVMVERTSGFPDAAPPGGGTPAPEILFHAPVRAGEHLRRAGEETRAGRQLLAAGTRIGPGELGVLAACGSAEVPVFRRPRVALLATGDELREPGEPLGDGEIYNSNLFALASLAELAGAVVLRAAVARDERTGLRRALEEALEECDLVAASGGVSMGRFDQVRPALAELGVREVFWRVAQKPGGPLLFARRDGSAGGAAARTPVFGLPGNPVSSLVCFLEYVFPALERMQGLTPAPRVPARLAAPFPLDEHKERFLFGVLSAGEEGLRALPTELTGSHMLTSAAGANCLLAAPPGPGRLPAGSTVRARLLPGARLA